MGKQQQLEQQELESFLNSFDLQSQIESEIAERLLSIYHANLVAAGFTEEVVQNIINIYFDSCEQLEEQLDNENEEE